MTRFFTADTHFTTNDFVGTIQRDARPFKSCKQMNHQIIKLFNRQAKKSDVIYFLGDFANYNRRETLTYKENLSLIKKIKADVILIVGNNEEKIIEREFDGDFEKFRAYLLKLGFKDVIMPGIYLDLASSNELFNKKFLCEKCRPPKQAKVYLVHKPIDHIEGVINLFGHIHNAVKVKRYGFNVGVDVNHFRLFSEDDILCQIGTIPLFDENVYN